MIPGLHTDVFTLVAEVIESKRKPSQPWGELAEAAFGTAPLVLGFIRQSILALGRQDVEPSGLSAPVGIAMLGMSSDHLVVDTGASALPVGAEVSFQLDYAALLSAMTSPFIAKVALSEAGRNTLRATDVGT